MNFLSSKFDIEMLSTSKPWPLDRLSGLTKEPILCKNDKSHEKGAKDHESKNIKLRDRFFYKDYLIFIKILWRIFFFITAIVDNTKLKPLLFIKL